MNSNCFKTVFSKRHGALVAVGEHASSQGKANGAHGANGAGRAGDPSFGLAQIMRHFLGALTASFALVTLAWAQPAVNALPTGGQVAQGAVQFSQSAQQLNINQASDRAAVNWQSFDIGAAAKVNVVQPSAQSVLLNRVGGTAPSQIFGQISANGRVILVNPNGMVFGKDGSVSAAAFTGSTLNMSDADFMAGNERYTRGGATGAIVNRGLIQAAPGGYVALLGASVSNEGRIVAPQGDVYLAAADAVTMPANAVALPIGQSGRIKLELSPASINAAVANQKGGTIVTEGGQVYLQAAAVNAALATIIQSGSIDTTGEQGGAVHVLADGGHIRVDGSIKANSTNGTAGGDIYIGRDKDTNVLAAVGDASGATLESKGGFVETSGSFLKVDDISVKAKDWLLDPTDIIISTGTDSATNNSGTFSGSGATSIINRNTLQTALGTTNVTITTASSGNGSGDITVAHSITWNSGNSLTLNATRNIVLNAALSGKDMTFNSQSVIGTAAGTINNNGGVLTLNTSNASATGTILGNISGSGSLVKTGAGTVTLSGAKTYTGGTTVSAGRLVGMDGGGPDYIFRGFGTEEIKIESGAAAFVNNRSGSAHNLFRNKVSGGGTLEIWGPNSLGNARTMVFGDFSKMTGTIALLGNNTQLTGDVISNGIVTEKRVNTTATVRVDSGANLNVWSTHGTPIIGALTGVGRVTAVVNGSASMTIGNGGGSGTFDGQITNSGTISITKIGAGTQTLTGNNNYTGTTTVNGGSLVNSNMASLRTSSIAIAEGATFEANVGTATTYLGSTTVSGGGTFKKNGAGVLTLSNGTSQLIFGTAGSSTPSIPPVPFTGLLDIAGGAIRNESLKGAFTANGSTINIASGSWLDIRGEAVQMRGLTGEGNIINSWNNTNALTFGVGSTASDNFIYNGVIGAANGATPSIVMNVTKSGAGTQVLGGNNLYTGTTTVSGGTLQIGNGGEEGTLGAGAVTLTNDANLVYKRSSNTSIANAISGQGNVSADITGSGNLSVDNAITLNTGTASPTRNKIDLRANGNVTLSKAITTNNTGLDAVKLVAGQAADYVANSDSWSSLSGNVIVNESGSITVGQGGIAALYSGTIGDTLGVGSMAESGSGKFRYNSDETTTNFSATNAGLVGKGSINPNGVTNANGVTIIYREAPTIQLTANSTTSGLIYNGQGKIGNQGVTDNTSNPGVLKNGDADARLTGDLSYSYNGASEAKNAGTYTVTASGQSSALGYKVEYVTGNLIIDRASLTAISGSKTYDGQSSLTVGTNGTLSLSGVNGETAKISAGSVTLSGKDVAANGQTVTAITADGLTTATDQTLDLNNYNLTITGSITTKARITPRPLDVAIAGVQTIYGSSAPAGTATVSGVLANDVVSADATVQLNGQRLSTSGNLNVGTYEQTAAVSLSGADAGNYTVGNGAVANYVVTPKQITPTATAADKVYDGNTSATLVASGVGILAGDVVTVQGLTGNFASKNVARDGSGNVVAQDVIITGTGSSLGGTDGANYTLVGTASVPVASARITPKDLSLAGITAADKVYDGNTTAQLSSANAVLTGLVAGENMTVSSTGSFDNKNVGTGKTVSLSNTLTGADIRNYSFVDQTSTTANITPKQLDVTIADVRNIYGSSVTPGTATVTGVLANDVVTSASTVQVNGQRLSTSGNLNVGTYVQTAAVSLSGADAGNYTVGNGAVANYVVTPKQITATATAADKVYDGNTSATLVASGVGILAGDVVTVQGLTGNFASRNVARDGSSNVVAQDVIITGTGSSLGGTDGANYTLVGTTTVPAASARITPKDLSLAGITAADKVYDGNTSAQLSSANAVLTGLVAGDSVNVSVQNAQGNFVDKNVARGANGQPVAKQVLVSGLALTGADQGNYQLGSSADVAATITPRTVTLTGSRALDKVVDSTTTAQVVPGTLEGLVAGEQLGVNASGEFEDALVGTNKLVNARFALVNGSNGLAGNYDLANTTAALRAAIVAFVPGPVDPSTGLPTGTSASRIRFSGSSGAGAATGVSDEPAGAELTEQCSVLNPQLCECEDTKIPGVEMCFAPTQVVSLKD